MKQFNLEEYLKNPDRKIVTRDGRKVRIICTDRISERFPVENQGIYPIIALVDGKYREDIMSYTENGLLFYDSEEKEDLFFEPKQKVCPLKKGDRVLMRDSYTFWKFDVFQSYKEGEFHPYIGIDDIYEQCAPLNEHTWKLLGTTDKYKEE